MTYNDLANEVLNIEAVERTDPLDTVSNNLDASLSYEVKSKLFDLLNTYFRSTEPTENIPYEFEIQLVNGSKPFYFTPRRLSWSERAEVRNIVGELLRKGIIRSSNSNFCSPIVLVKKKNNSYRMCIDYRALNKITLKDRYSLPLMEDQIDVR